MADVRAKRVLVVDDEPAMREVLSARLLRWGYDTATAGTAKEAKETAATFLPDVVVCDLVLPDGSGQDLLESFITSDARRTIVLVTSYGTIDTAVRAIKAGAVNFLEKPIDYAVLRQLLERAPHLTAMPDTNEGGMIGEHPLLTHLLERVRAAAQSDASVLIVGESGTGKELVARTIQQLSRRKEQPFVIVNAAAIPETLVEAELFGAEKGAFTGADHKRVGLFEQANGGTIFLDEITEMPISLQPKLLRTLEDGRVRRLGGKGEIPCDVRVIAATNRNPTAAVEQGVLRHDLVYRLDVLRIDMPPLRERHSDIPLLTAAFLADCARRYQTPPCGLDKDALSALTQHTWPGNIRELKNVVERAFVLAQPGPITAAHLGAPFTTLSAGVHVSEKATDASTDIVIPAGLTLADAERIVIVETLKRTGNNKAETARRLGLDVKTIRNKLKTFGLTDAGSGAAS